MPPRLIAADVLDIPMPWCGNGNRRHGELPVNRKPVDRPMSSCPFDPTLSLTGARRWSPPTGLGTDTSPGADATIPVRCAVTRMTGVRPFGLRVARKYRIT